MQGGREWMGGVEVGWVWGGGKEWGGRVVVVLGGGDGCLAALLQGPRSRRKRRHGFILVARCSWGWGEMRDSRCGRGGEGMGGREGGGEGGHLLEISRYTDLE